VRASACGGANLDGGGAEGEYGGARAFRVAVEVDEDVDAVGVDGPRRIAVGEATEVHHPLCTVLHAAANVAEIVRRRGVDRDLGSGVRG